MTASCTEKGSGTGGGGLIVQRPHTRAHTQSHFTSHRITRPHLSTQKWANKFSSRSYMNWQSCRLMYSHGYWFYLSMNAYVNTHPFSCACSVSVLWGRKDPIWYDLESRERSGGREGWSVRNEVMVSVRCLLQILVRNEMTLNWLR